MENNNNMENMDKKSTGNTNKKVIIAVVVLAVCLIAAGIGYPMAKAYMIKKDPVNYLLYASSQNQSNAVDASVTGNLSMTDEALSQMTAYMSSDPEAMSSFIKSIVEEVNFNGRVKFRADLDNKKFNLFENIGFQYGENKLLSVEVGYIDEQAFYRMPEVYNKAFVMTKADFFDYVKQEENVDLSEVSWDKYIDLLKVENDTEYQAILKDKAKYEDLIRTFLADLKANGKTDVTLADGSVVKCDLLEMDVDYNKVMDLYIQIFKVAKEDQNVKALVQKKALAALNLVLESGDYKLMGVEESEIKDAIEKVTNDFDTSWNEMLDELVSTYENIKTEMAASTDINMAYHMAFAIDNKFNLRQFKMKADTNGIVINEIVTYNAYGDDVKFDEKFSDDEKVSVKDMISDPSYTEEVTKDVIKTGFSAFLASDAFTSTVKDIKEKASVLPEEESQQIISSLDYVLDNQEMLINMLLGQY